MKKASFPLLLAAALAALAALSSCGLAARWRIQSASRPLNAAVEDPALPAASRRVLEQARDAAAFSASRYGLEREAARLRFLGGERSALAYRLTVAQPRQAKAEKVGYFHEAEAAERQAEAARAKGRLALVEPLSSTRGLGYGPSPLFSGLAALSQERLVEWVNLELFSAAFAAGAWKGEGEGFPAFAAEMATREYLAERLSAASPLLGAYISEKRDERTFELLFEDYRSRLLTLYGQDPLPEDWERLRAFLEESWMREYRAAYPNRFITNSFRDFGLGGVPDAAVAARPLPPPGFGDWERRYQAAGERLAALLAESGRR